MLPTTDDSNHKLECSLRVVCTRHLLRRVRAEAREVKRRTVSEFIRTVLEQYFSEKDRRQSVP